MGEKKEEEERATVLPTEKERKELYCQSTHPPTHPPTFSSSGVKSF